MERIINLKHSNDTFLYAASRTLERAAYNGLQILIAFYLMDIVLKIEGMGTVSIFGLFASSLIFSHILGAIIGDLLIGNKNAAAVGGMTQSLGIFVFCIPSNTDIYIYTGLLFIVLGGGLYTPNITSVFGKSYLNKTKLLDAGFTIFFLASKSGGFLGALAIGYIGEIYGWKLGFIVAGVAMLLSATLIFFSKDEKIEPVTENKIVVSQQLINISIALILVVLFWVLSEPGSMQLFYLKLDLVEMSALNIPQEIWEYINQGFIFSISISAIIFWTFFYSNQLFKLAAGFIFGAMSVGVLFFIPKTPAESDTALYLLSVLFFWISKIHIAPIIHSVITQFANPKYLATLSCLLFVPTKLALVIVNRFSDILRDPVFGPKIGVFAMIIFGIGLIALHTFRNKKNSLQE